MAGENSFRDDFFEAVEGQTGAVGPAASEEQIATWERQQGLRLPALLRQAFTQQDGGYVRGRPIFLERLEAMTPVEDGLLDYAELAESDLVDAETGLDYGRMVYLGGDDDRGCMLLLYYGDNGPQGEPSVYGFWSEADKIDRLAETVYDLLEGVGRPNTA